MKRNDKLDTTWTLPRRGGGSLWSGDPSTASRRTSWPGEPDYMPWTGSLSSSSSSHRELLSQSGLEYTLTFFIVFCCQDSFCCQFFLILLPGTLGERVSGMWDLPRQQEEAPSAGLASANILVADTFHVIFSKCVFGLALDDHVSCQIW